MSDDSGSQLSQDTRDLLMMQTPLDSRDLIVYDVPLTIPTLEFTSQEMAELFQTDSPLKMEEISSSGHHYAAAVEQPTVSRNLRSSKHILMEDMPGLYNFRLSFEQKEKYAKNHPACYSKAHNMLIVKPESPITIKMEAACDMRQLFVTVVAVYDAPEHHEIPVMNCMNHGGSSKQFISCRNPEAKDMRLGQRACLNIPLRDLRDVSNHSGRTLLENLEFNCRSSCSTDSQYGINMRKLALVFTLEDSASVVIGRAKVFLKVAVSPGRDLTNLEKGPAKKRRRTDSGVSGTGAKAIKGKYSVVSHHKRTYEVIVAMAHRMEALDDPDLYLETLTGSQGSMPASGEKGRDGTYTLETWLARYHLEQYTVVLENGGYTTPQKLQGLKTGDLDRLLITDMAHRHLLQHAITSLGLKKFIRDKENKGIN